jgi:hypothetical protein
VSSTGAAAAVRHRPFIYSLLCWHGRAIAANSAAHRRAFRVDADTVHLKRTDEGFLVMIKEPWEIFFEGDVQLSNDFLGSGRARRELESRD